MDTIDSANRIVTSPLGTSKAAPHRNLHDEKHSLADADSSTSKRHVVLRWLINDILFIAMVSLTLIGVAFRLPVLYWVVLIPIFGVISVVEGWKHFATRTERLGLIYGLASVWCALLLAIYLIHNGGVQGVMNANATSLAVITLLALGTFVAGVLARVWQICAVGAILFLAVPGLGWLDQSPLLLSAVAVFIVTLGALAWWASKRPE